MTTATASRPSAVPGSVLVGSDSRPGIVYRTSAHGCDCAAFYFGRIRDPKFRCKHILRLFPAPHLCEWCGMSPTRDTLPFCSERCASEARALDDRTGHEVDPCHGRHLALSAPPTCAGYLREHPATAERIATFWCDACSPEDCR